MTKRRPVYFLVKSNKMPVNFCICRQKLADYDKSSPFFIWRICAICSVENHRFKI